MITKTQLAVIAILIVATQCEEEIFIGEETLSTSQAWGFGMLAGVCLAITGLIAEQILFCVKEHISAVTFTIILNCLYALACGTMVGDVVLHSLPQAYANPHTKVSIVALLFMIAIFVFVMMQRGFKLCGLTSQRWGTVEEDILQRGHDNLGIEADHPREGAPGQRAQTLTLNDHWRSLTLNQKNLREQLRQIKEQKEEQRAIKVNGVRYRSSTGKYLLDRGDKQQQMHAHPESGTNFEPGDHNQKVKQFQEFNQIDVDFHEGDEDKNKNKIEAVRSFSTYNRISDLMRSKKLIEEAKNRQEQQNKNNKEGNCFERFKGKEAEGYLEIFTSFVHNFFGGLALGAGFGTRNRNQFIPILVAVYVHAVPRELGDISILIKSRFDDCQAKVCSALPKIMIVVGVAAGLGLETTSEAAKYYIVSFVAGSFIYIASDIWKNLFQTSSLKRNIAECSLLIIGVGIQYLLLLIE